MNSGMSDFIKECVEFRALIRAEDLEEARFYFTKCDQYHCGHIDCNKFRALIGGESV